MQNYETQIQQSIELFDKLYNLLDKTRIPRFNEELAKLVPTEKSEIFLAAGMVYEPASIGFSVFITNTAQNINPQNLLLPEIFSIWVKRNSHTKINAVKTCLSELNMQVSNQWDIDFVSVYYDASLVQNGFHFRIFDRIGYEHEKKRA